MFSEPRVLLSDTLDIELDISNTNEKLLWHSILIFFGALAGLCRFLGIANIYVRQSM